MFRIFPLSFAILQKKEGEGTDLVCSIKKGGYMLPPGRLTSRLRSRAFTWEYKPLVMGPPLSGCRGAAGRMAVSLFPAVLCLPGRKRPSLVAKGVLLGPSGLCFV